MSFCHHQHFFNGLAQMPNTLSVCTRTLGSVGRVLAAFVADMGQPKQTGGSKCSSELRGCRRKNSWTQRCCCVEWCMCAFDVWYEWALPACMCVCTCMVLASMLIIVHVCCDDVASAFAWMANMRRHDFASNYGCCSTGNGLITGERLCVCCAWLCATLLGGKRSDVNYPWRPAIHTYTYIYIYICLCIYMCINIFNYICIFIYQNVYIYMYIHLSLWLLPASMADACHW